MNETTNCINEEKITVPDYVPRDPKYTAEMIAFMAGSDPSLEERRELLFTKIEHFQHISRTPEEVNELLNYRLNELQKDETAVYGKPLSSRIPMGWDGLILYWQNNPHVLSDAMAITTSVMNTVMHSLRQINASNAIMAQFNNYNTWITRLVQEALAIANEATQTQPAEVPDVPPAAPSEPEDADDSYNDPRMSVETE